MSPASFPTINNGTQRSSRRGVASSARLRRLAVAVLPLVAVVACNGILGIGEPEDPPGETRGGGGNAGSFGEQGGEGGDGTGGSGVSREGGTGGTRATGGNASGGAGPDGDDGGGATGGIHGGTSGAGVAGTRPEGGESGAGEAGIGGTAGAGASGDAGAGAAGDSGAGGGGGGGDPTGGCDPDGFFGPPIRLPINDDVARIFFARLTDDELTMVFQDINFDIWIADRANKMDDFRDPRKMAEVSTGLEEWSPTLTGDGLTLFFQRNSDIWAIFVATRERRSDVFSEPVQVLSLDHTSGGYVVPNGQAMYLSWNGNKYSVFRAERRAGSFVFGPRVELSELSALGTAVLPVVSADELTIYFGSTRSGGFGLGDIYRARRSSRDDPFGEAKHVSELNSGQEEMPDWISRDHCTIYMHRWVPGAGEVIFTAKRTR